MKSFLICTLLMTFCLQGTGFKAEQLQYERVKKAYEEKYKSFAALLQGKDIAVNELEIIIRAYKSEGILELWGKEKDKTEFTLIKEYPVCAPSGHEGPKRRQGDYQVPEGFYRLEHFNPWSSFYLSFSINYPNESDLILGDRHHPGGNICIHGNCVTIGCIPLTDEGIKELYVAAVEAKNNGQSQIRVTIFPCRLEDATLKALQNRWADNPDYLNLWTDMKTEYDYFKQHHRTLSVSVQPNGRFRFE
jgi:murein L,D-transpeptidase YafK